MGNLFEKELGIPLPACCNTGDCCKGASPSKPYHQLLAMAKDGDEFARGFFSIMVPYETHEQARKVTPGLVERTLKAALKSKDFHGPEDIVFYRCRYQTEDNKCGVWEDRPQFCRDYPNTPYVVMAPGCAFEDWGKTCREKFEHMKTEVSHLKKLKEELAALHQQQDASGQGPEYTKIDDADSPSHNTDNLSLLLSLTGLYLASPMHSVYLMRGATSHDILRSDSKTGS